LRRRYFLLLNKYFDPSIELKRRYLIHTVYRVQTRYHTNLPKSVWENWNKQISENSSDVVYLREYTGKTNNGSSLWKVKLDNKDIFVVFRDPYVVTALNPNFPDVYEAVQLQLAKEDPHEYQHPNKNQFIAPLKNGRTTSKSVGRGDLGKYYRQRTKSKKSC
jgi:hypothetical protein